MLAQWAPVYERARMSALIYAGMQTFSNCDSYVKQKLWYRFDSFKGRLVEKKEDQRLTTKMVEQDVKADLKYK